MKKARFAIVFAMLLATMCALSICASAATYSGNCGADGDNLTWSLDMADGVLHVTGSGAMKNYHPATRGTNIAAALQVLRSATA